MKKLMKKQKTSLNNIKVLILPVVVSTILLISASYAWFTFFSDVDSTLSGHVIGWNIDFDGESNIENEYEILISNIYPGMQDYRYEFPINNTGEASAVITYNIKKIKILNTIYEVGNTYDGITLTHENFLEYLNSIYPFQMNINISKNIIATNEESIFTYELSWPYEVYLKVSDDATFNKNMDYYILEDLEYKIVNVKSSTFDSMKSDLYYLNDELDTYWGGKSFDFKNENPDSACVELKFSINATQYIE